MTKGKGQATGENIQEMEGKHKRKRGLYLTGNRRKLFSKRRKQNPTKDFKCLLLAAPAPWLAHASLKAELRSIENLFGQHLIG